MALDLSDSDPNSHDALAPVYSALWRDMSTSAWMSDGNIFLSDWLYSDSDTVLHIEDLRCGGRERRLRCRFTLRREGASAEFGGRQLPDRLFCGALLVSGQSEEDVWQVVRRLYSGAVHSSTTMTCSEFVRVR